MHIIQTIQDGDILYVFTDDTEQDILILKEEYKNGNNISSNKIHLGYGDPVFCKFNFLGKLYPCIALWFNNEYSLLNYTKDYLDTIINY